MSFERWNIDRRYISGEDDKVIVDLPSGERIEVTFDGIDPRAVLVHIDETETQLVPA